MGQGGSHQKKVVTLVLNPDSKQSSVSKIHLDKKVSWQGLRRTIDTVFPELVGHQLNVTWNSPDKRTCKVSSNEELLVAVQTMGEKTEFNIKRLKSVEDVPDKGNKDAKTVRRSSIKDNPTVARFVKPITRMFSHKDSKHDISELPTPPTKPPEQTKKIHEQPKKIPEQPKKQLDKSDKQSDIMKSLTDLNKKLSTKK